MQQERNLRFDKFQSNNQHQWIDVLDLVSIWYNYAYRYSSLQSLLCLGANMKKTSLQRGTVFTLQGPRPGNNCFTISPNYMISMVYIG